MTDDNYPAHTDHQPQTDMTISNTGHEFLDVFREKDWIMMQQAQQAAMGEIIRNIAHQWRQPLNLLGLIVQDIPVTYRKGEMTEEYLKENVTKAKSLIFQMSQTIDDFRNIFRTDEEKSRFQLTPALNRSLELIKGSFDALQIRVHLDISEDRAIFGYPNEFSQAVFNILATTRDIFHERKSNRPEIRITVTSDRERTVMMITDNGGGIPRNVLEKIGEPFCHTNGPDKGMGVGLYISKMIIEQNLGGTLTARNNAVGAEFKLEIGTA